MKIRVPGIDRWLAALAVLLLFTVSAQAAGHPEPEHGDFVMRDFRFAGGAMLPEVRIHYFTLGTPARDQSGRVTNAVLLLHGTTGRGEGFLVEGIAGVLFGPGQPLDATRYFVIVPDNLGSAGSTKPSDGLKAGFPRYGYADMVEAQRRLVTDGLHVDHLRLIVGASMGGMHAWMWAVNHPDFMDAVMPIVCLPVPIAGRNRIQRRLISDAIRGDPEWMHGEYTKPPQGLSVALKMAIIGANSAKALYREAPTQAATDALLDRRIRERLRSTDANDFLYAWEASYDYDPGPGLERITAAVTAVNFADDEINPPELGVMEREIRRVARGKYVLVPESERTRGHVSFFDATLWSEYLVELLARTSR
jgi:homoserine O-acetyltransferase/O-succinyltransferase